MLLVAGTCAAAFLAWLAAPILFGDPLPSRSQPEPVESDNARPARDSAASVATASSDPTPRQPVPLGTLLRVRGANGVLPNAQVRRVREVAPAQMAPGDLLAIADERGEARVDWRNTMNELVVVSADDHGSRLTGEASEITLLPLIFHDVLCVSMDGTPIPGVTVEASRTSFRPECVRDSQSPGMDKSCVYASETDASGRATLRLQPGLNHVQATARGLASIGGPTTFDPATTRHTEMRLARTKGAVVKVPDDVLVAFGAFPRAKTLKGGNTLGDTLFSQLSHRYPRAEGHAVFVTLAPEKDALEGLGEVVFTLWLERGGKVEHRVALDFLDIEAPTVRVACFPPAAQTSGKIGLRVIDPDGRECKRPLPLTIQQVITGQVNPSAWFRLRTDGRMQHALLPGHYRVIGEGGLAQVVDTPFEVRPGMEAIVEVRLAQAVGEVKWHASVAGRQPSRVFLHVSSKDRSSLSVEIRESLPPSGSLWLPFGTYEVRASCFGGTPSTATVVLQSEISSELRLSL